jgi:acetyl-CoA carboxylase carboxyltransferase component
MSHTKLSARERIDYLFDENTFVEIGSLVTARNTDYNLGSKDTPGDGVITGYGIVDRRMVYVYSQDAAVLGGSIGEMHARKIAGIYDLAMKTGSPVVSLIDCAGLRLQEAGDALQAFGSIFGRQAKASGKVPQICGIFGSCGGGSAVMAGLSDFTLLEQNAGALFINSPNTLDGNRKEKLDTSGWEYQAVQAGNVDFVCDGEEALLTQIRELLTFLPSDYEADDVYVDCTDNLNRIIPELAETEYDAHFLLQSIADHGQFLETKRMYAGEMVTGLFRLNGEVLGAIANQPVDGKSLLTTEGVEKATRFLHFCDAFSLPVLTVTNVSGLQASEKEERQMAGALARFVSAQAASTVPKVNLITGDAFGTASIAMNSKAIGADFVLAWPGAAIGMMDAGQAVRIMYADEIAESAEQLALIREKTEAYQELQSSAIAAAKRGYVDDIIEPDATRKRLIAAFEMLYGKKETVPSRKHASI